MNARTDRRSAAERKAYAKALHRERDFLNATSLRGTRDRKTFNVYTRCGAFSLR